MKFYFELQYKRFQRKLSEMGIQPYLGITLLIFAFIGFSIFLFQKSIYAEYIYGFLALSLMAGLGEKQRNDFLHLCYQKSSFYKIRLGENYLYILPFVTFLLIQQKFIVAAIIIILAGLMAFLPFQSKWSFSIPTPFSKYPFEFTKGFRRLFLIYPASYFLLYKSITVGNFNLGIFAIGVMIMIHLSYYFKPENKYFVWIFSSNPKTFLWKKIGTSLAYSSLAILPILILLGIGFPEEIFILAGMLLMNALLLSTIILAKYSAFPKEMSLPQWVLFALSIWFPPILIIAIIYFYSQSIKKLKEILQ